MGSEPIMGMPSDRRMRQRVVNGFDGGGGIADAVDAIPERFRGVAPPRRTARRSRVAAVLEQRHHLCFDNANARLATATVGRTAWYSAVQYDRHRMS